MIKEWIGTAAALAITAGSANAALLLSAVSVTDLGNGEHQWEYTVAVQPNAVMRSVATLPPAGSLANDAFTLFDFVGYVPGSANITNLLAGRTFVLTEQAIGLTPALVTPTDSAALPNFTVALIAGPDVVPGPNATDVFTLVLRTTAGGIVPGGFTNFTGQTGSRVTGLTQSNIGLVQAPIPEPAALGLLAPAALMLTRRRK